MDDELETLVIGVRADTQGFTRDVQALRAQLDGPLAQGMEAAGRTLETTLARAIRTGRFGFEELQQVALSVLAQIAQAALVPAMGRVGGGAGGAGLVSAILGGLLGASGLGAPGRATGGPVSPGRAYRVGENGPEYFVPTSAGRVETGMGSGGSRGGGGPVVHLSVQIGDGGASAPDALVRSSRQVARAVRRALDA